MVSRKSDQYVQKNEIRHLLTPRTRINSKWIKDLNFRSQTIKILQENIYSKMSDITPRKFLMDISPQQGNQKKNTQTTKKNYIKVTSVFYSKGNHQQNKKRTHRMGEHIC